MEKEFINTQMVPNTLEIGKMINNKDMESKPGLIRQDMKEIISKAKKMVIFLILGKGKFLWADGSRFEGEF